MISPFLFVIVVDHLLRLASLPTQDYLHDIQQDSKNTGCLDFGNDISLLESSIPSASVQLTATANAAREDRLIINVQHFNRRGILLGKHSGD